MENYIYGFIMDQYGLICKTVNGMHGFHLKPCKSHFFYELILMKIWIPSQNLVEDTHTEF
jgi:hypothetical protein